LNCYFPQKQILLSGCCSLELTIAYCFPHNHSTAELEYFDLEKCRKYKAFHPYRRSNKDENRNGMLYFQGFQNIPDAEFFEKDFFLKLKKRMPLLTPVLLFVTL